MEAFRIDMLLFCRVKKLICDTARLLVLFVGGIMGGYCYL